MHKLKTAYREFDIKTIVLIISAFCLSACAGSEGDSIAKQSKIMYHAVDKNDIAKLNIQLGEKAFDGQLEITYNSLYKDSGDVNGIIKGDTLKGTYYFQHYGIPKWERIPISILKKDSKLIMGVGDMEIYMNMTFFKKRVPIDYKHVKFTFEKVN